MNFEQMEMIEGGMWTSCLFGALGLISIGIAIASVPATGGLSAGFLVGFIGNSIVTGGPIGECLSWQYF